MAEELSNIVRRFYHGESPAHDFHHLARVDGLARTLCRSEGGSLEVISAASYLHDLHRHLERIEGSPVNPTAGDNLACELLKRACIPDHYYEPILQAIHYTDIFSFSDMQCGESSLESKIVRDADNLDAIGAIGIARAFSYGGHFDIPIWRPEAKISAKYDPETRSISTVHHLEEKLVRLIGEFELESARELALERHSYILEFIHRFIREWQNAFDGSDARIDSFGRS